MSYFSFWEHDIRMLCTLYTRQFQTSFALDTSLINDTNYISKKSFKAALTCQSVSYMYVLQHRLSYLWWNMYMCIAKQYKLQSQKFTMFIDHFHISNDCWIHAEFWIDEYSNKKPRGGGGTFPFFMENLKYLYCYIIFNDANVTTHISVFKLV